MLGFSEELNQLLLQLYLEHRKEIRSILSQLSPSLPHYHNLEWRLDVQVRFWGGQMAERLGNRAINQKVAGSIPTREK